MNKETTIKAGGVHRKLSDARQKFHALELKKSGKNTFAGYSYFELGDFLLPALQVFGEVGLGATISFDATLATMTITDLDNVGDTITITSPMGSAALKGCHEVQNIGAVETYQRRYLWVAALEIVEHDALDATTGNIAPETRAANDRPTTGEAPPEKRVKLDGPYTSKTALWKAVREFDRTLRGMGDSAEFEAFLQTDEVVELLDQCKRDAPQLLDTGEGLPEEYEPLLSLIKRLRHELANADESWRTNPIMAG
jgi:hypothetical protein